MALIKQIGRFLVVGGLAFLVDYGVLWTMVDLLKANYLVASTLSFSISVIFNYALSSIWVFESAGNGNQIGNFVVFVAMSVVGLLLNLAIMWFAVDALELYYLVAKVGSTGIVMIYNFISRKIILEKRCVT